MIDIEDQIKFLEARVAASHPLAAIADRIRIAHYVAPQLRKSIPRKGKEHVLDRAKDQAEAIIDRITRGCDRLAVILDGKVPHPRDDHARAQMLIQQLRFAASGLDPMPSHEQVDVVCDRLHTLASADRNLEIAEAKKQYLAHAARLAAEQNKPKPPLSPAARAVATVLCALASGQRLKQDAIVLQVHKQCRRTVTVETIRGSVFRQLKPWGMKHDKNRDSVGYYIEPSEKAALRLELKRLASTSVSTT